MCAGIAPIPANVRDEYERRLFELLEGVPGWRRPRC
jgi:hypothetical protein